MGTDAIALDEKNKAYFKKKKIRKYIFVSLMLIYPLLQFAIFWVYINQYGIAQFSALFFHDAAMEMDRF